MVVPYGHVPASQLAASLEEHRKWWPGEWPKASPEGTKPNRRARKGIPVSAQRKCAMVCRPPLPLFGTALRKPLPDIVVGLALPHENHSSGVVLHQIEVWN